MFAALARFDRLLALTLAIAFAGALLLVGFQLAEAFNDPPVSQSSVQSLEAYSDRARWINTFQDIGQGLLTLALPLALLAFALARRDADEGAPRRRA